MSAAVVPGAKLLPTTTGGPELAPLMLIPPLVSRTVAWAFAEVSAERRRFSSGRRRWAGFAVDGVFFAAEDEVLLPVLDPRLADAER
jgi:hypothetical protein